MTVERDPFEVLQVSPRASWSALRAAYHALARRFHPDGSTPDATRMTEINAAYERLERERRTTRLQGSGAVPVGPGAMGSWGTSAPGVGPLMRRVMAARRVETPVLDFGQYAGWRISDVAEHDPRYLRWLSRHSSGVRFRSVIEQVLGADPEIGRRAALIR